MFALAPDVGCDEDRLFLVFAIQAPALCWHASRLPRLALIGQACDVAFTAPSSGSKMPAIPRLLGHDQRFGEPAGNGANDP
jgi:hypothetical protein